MSDSESLLEWERVNTFGNDRADRSSLILNASAKSYPRNKTSPFESVPTAVPHFSLETLQSGLSAPSFDDRPIPDSLRTPPFEPPLPIPVFAESAPERASDMDRAVHRGMQIVGNPQRSR